MWVHQPVLSMSSPTFPVPLFSRAVSQVVGSILSILDQKPEADSNDRRVSLIIFAYLCTENPWELQSTSVLICLHWQLD